MTILSKTNLLKWSGSLIIICGILIFLANALGFVNIMKAIGILHLITGIFSIMFASANKQLKFGLMTFFVQGLSRITYGLYLLFIVSTLNDFVFASAILTIFIALFEYWFCFYVVTFEKFNFKIVVYNLVMGTLSGVIGVILIAGMASEKNVLPIIAVLMFGVGALTILFISRIRNMTIEKQ